MRAGALRGVLGVLAVSALGGCAAYDSINTMMEESARKREEARFSTAKMACDKYGFRAGTDTYAQCLQSEVNQIKNREAIAEAGRKAAAAAEAAGSKTMNCRKDIMGNIQCTPN
jgi:hypothetical protein